MAEANEVKEAREALEADIAAAEPKDEPKAEEPKETPKEEPKPEEPKPEPQPEPKKAEPVTRKAELIPASKFHEVRHELQAEKEARKRLEDEMAAIKAKPAAQQGDDLDELAKEIAGDEASPEVVKRILAAAKGAVKAPDTSALEERLNRIEAEKQKQADEMRYRTEEEAVIGKFPELKAYAKDLKDMAYTQGNESIPLEYLALKLKSDLNLGAPVAPAETVSAPPAGHERDLSNLTEDDFAQLGDTDIDRFVARNRAKR